MRCLYRRIHSTLQAVVWGTMLLLVFFVLYMNWAPFGVTFVKDFRRASSADNSQFISDLTPGDRVQERTVLLIDPVYAHVRAPRKFDEAIVRIEGAHLSGARLALQIGEKREQFIFGERLGQNNARDGARNSVAADFAFPASRGFRDGEGRYTFIFSFDDAIEPPPSVTRMSVRFFNQK